MPLVQPTIILNVFKLEYEFIHGYRSRSVVFHISIINNKMKSEYVISKLINSWNILWKAISAKFDKFIKEDDVLNKFVGKMFWVWDENHRLQAWKFVIDKQYSGEAT